MKIKTTILFIALFILYSCNQSQPKQNSKNYDNTSTTNNNQEVKTEISAEENLLKISFFDTDKNEIEYQKIDLTKNNDKSVNELENTLVSNGEKSTMYCLEWIRDEWGSYKGRRAKFSVWQPKRNSGFGCCVWVNISRNGKIIARQKVRVTRTRHLRILIGSINGVSQGVSSCR